MSVLQVKLVHPRTARAPLSVSACPGSDSDAFSARLSAAPPLIRRTVCAVTSQLRPALAVPLANTRAQGRRSSPKSFRPPTNQSASSGSVTHARDSIDANRAELNIAAHGGNGA